AVTAANIRLLMFRIALSSPGTTLGGTGLQATRVRSSQWGQIPHRLAKTLSDVTSIGYGLGRVGLGAVTGEEDAEAGDAAFELLELADVDDDRGEPEVGQVVRGARGGGGDQDAVAAERDDVAAGLLGDRPDGREEAGRDQLGQHQER